MIFGALGDIHGDFESARRIMRRCPDVLFWTSVGDVADDRGGYEGLDAPLYFIKGNNENFDRLAAGDLAPNLHYIPNAQLIVVHGVSVAGLGGTLAPTWYDTAARDLPYPAAPARGSPELRRASEASRVAAPGGGAPGASEKRGAPRAVRDDKRRHFVRNEVETCKTLPGVDLFLTHEAPRPYRVGQGIDAGKTPVNEVLASMSPRLHLFGHHHRFSEQHVQGVRSVGLDLVSRSYLLIDADTMEYDARSTE